METEISCSKSLKIILGIEALVVVISWGIVIGYGLSGKNIVIGLNVIAILQLVFAMIDSFLLDIIN